MDPGKELEKLLAELMYIVGSSHVSYDAKAEFCKTTGKITQVIFEPDKKTITGYHVYDRELFSQHLTRRDCSLSSVVLWADGRIGVFPK